MGDTRRHAADGPHLNGVQVVARSNRAGPTNILGVSLTEDPIFCVLTRTLLGKWAVYHNAYHNRERKRRALLLPPLRIHGGRASKRVGAVADVRRNLGRGLYSGDADRLPLGSGARAWIRTDLRGSGGRATRQACQSYWQAPSFVTMAAARRSPCPDSRYMAHTKEPLMSLPTMALRGCGS